MISHFVKIRAVSNRIEHGEYTEYVKNKKESLLRSPFTPW